MITLNAAVWQTLQQLIGNSAATNGNQPMRILEIGAGTGAMFERMCASQRAPVYEYVAIDAEAENMRSAREKLPGWAARQGLVVEASTGANLPLIFRNGQSGCTTTLDASAVDLFAFLDQPDQTAQYDLLIAHAFLDLVDAQSVLPRLARLLKSGGVFYFPINFDGATILQPAIDPAFDALVEARYHLTMDERVINGQPSGDSQTGRHLFGHLRDAGFQILNAGSSDWVVFGQPDEQGQTVYPADEAYFLHFIIDTMRGALADDAALESARFAQWIEQRHQQIERGELVYIAHQLDFVGKLA
ncbi:MAG: class I SAM-dependent methyltransferase [Caldilineaceae bacterium]